MIHLGDITKITGAEIEPVWVVTGGSPCQDLSIAGKRAGLAGARSGLFMEQVRIVEAQGRGQPTVQGAGQLHRPALLGLDAAAHGAVSAGGCDVGELI